MRTTEVTHGAGHYPVRGLGVHWTSVSPEAVYREHLTPLRPAVRWSLPCSDQLAHLVHLMVYFSV